MFDFHYDRTRYFNMQSQNSKDFVMPFIEKYLPIKAGLRILEIGCGEAGVLEPFLQRGCFVVGVEFDTPRLDLANEKLADYVKTNKALFIGKDIYEVDAEELGGVFDIIILKDVIEHIHNQPKLMAEMQRFLHKDGCIFFGFPPWQMPFGGHQQLCRTKWLSKIPYWHLLPYSWYKAILTKFNEPVADLLEIRDTQISIEQFERYAQYTNYRIVNKTHYIINPIYSFKFGIKPLKQLPILRSIPFVRNFFTTCVYYLIAKK